MLAARRRVRPHAARQQQRVLPGQPDVVAVLGDRSPKDSSCWRSPAGRWRCARASRCCGARGSSPARARPAASCATSRGCGPTAGRWATRTGCRRRPGRWRCCSAATRRGSTTPRRAGRRCDAAGAAQRRRGADPVRACRAARWAAGNCWSTRRRRRRRRRSCPPRPTACELRPASDRGVAAAHRRGEQSPARADAGIPDHRRAACSGVWRPGTPARPGPRLERAAQVGRRRGLPWHARGRTHGGTGTHVGARGKVTRVRPGSRPRPVCTGRVPR